MSWIRMSLSLYVDWHITLAMPKLTTKMGLMVGMELFTKSCVPFGTALTKEVHQRMVTEMVRVTGIAGDGFSRLLNGIVVAIGNVGRRPPSGSKDHAVSTWSALFREHIPLPNGFQRAKAVRRGTRTSWSDHFSRLMHCCSFRLNVTVLRKMAVGIGDRSKESQMLFYWSRRSVLG